MGSVVMFDEVKVFSATMFRDRGQLGERITKWINAHRDGLEIVDKTVQQSSDNEYHCLSIILFCRKLHP